MRFPNLITDMKLTVEYKVSKAGRVGLVPTSYVSRERMFARCPYRFSHLPFLADPTCLAIRDFFLSFRISLMYSQRGDKLLTPILTWSHGFRPGWSRCESRPPFAVPPCAQVVKLVTESVCDYFLILLRRDAAAYFPRVDSPGLQPKPAGETAQTPNQRPSRKRN